MGGGGGGEGPPKSKFLKGSMKLKVCNTKNFRGVRGPKPKDLLWEGYGYFLREYILETVFICNFRRGLLMTVVP